ncbi:MAG TPA: hypothetical protein DE045_02495 [Oceanospirillaceae bacterium]|nr:hypothetical protein [Oceanospirillaceae bacterium]
MRVLYSLILVAFATVCSTHALSSGSVLDGVWSNNYGSVMKLSVSQTGEVSGCYSSTTGSSGAYHVSGFFDITPVAQPASDAIHQSALAIAIPWHSYLTSSKSDPSWHWTSSMAGMYYIDPANSQEKLELVNALNTTTLLSGYNLETGLYPETLFFSRYKDQNWKCPITNDFSEPNLANLIDGSWIGQDYALSLVDLGSGFINGTAQLGTSYYPVRGFYDYDPLVPGAADNISISLVVSNLSADGISNEHSQIALTGLIDQQTRTDMSLYGFKTFAATTFTSTVLSNSHFYKTNELENYTSSVLQNEYTDVQGSYVNAIGIPLHVGLAKNNGGTPWYGELSFGNMNSNKSNSNRQQLRFMMDTGTSSVWVASSDCTSWACQYHSQYDKNYSDKWCYGDDVILTQCSKTGPHNGSSELGPWGKFDYRYMIDELTLSGVIQNNGSQKIGSIQYDVMPFLEATQLINGTNPPNTNWNDLVADGSMGVPSNDPFINTTLVSNLYRLGYMQDKVVSYYTSKDYSRGEVIFGGVDQSKYDPSSLEFFDLDPDVASKILTPNQVSYLWGTKLVGVSTAARGPISLTNNTELGLPYVAFCPDSGSSRFKGDVKLIAAIKTAITGSDQDLTVFSSQARDVFTNVVLSLENSKGSVIDYVVTPAQYFQTFPNDGLNTKYPVDKFPNMYVLGFHGLESSSSSGAQNVLIGGSLFMDNFYTIFNYPVAGRGSVGIASRIQ